MVRHQVYSLQCLCSSAARVSLGQAGSALRLRESEEVETADTVAEWVEERSGELLFRERHWRVVEGSIGSAVGELVVQVWCQRS
jgi:hypothetical protein